MNEWVWSYLLQSSAALFCLSYEWNYSQVIKNVHKFFKNMSVVESGNRQFEIRFLVAC